MQKRGKRRCLSLLCCGKRLLCYSQSQSFCNSPSKLRIGFVEVANLAELDLLRLYWSHGTYNIAYEPGTLFFAKQTVQVTRLGVVIVMIIRHAIRLAGDFKSSCLMLR